MKRIALLTATAAVFAALLASGSAPAQVVARAAQDNCPHSQSSNPPPTPSQLGHPLNYVLAENCTASSQDIESKVAVVHANGRSDQATNLAYAYSYNCNPGCETIAVAYQVVLNSANSPDQSPQNAAVAVNDTCDGCATFAYADQYALDVPPGTHLSGSTRQAIAQIRQQVTQDVNAGMSFPDLDASLRALATQLQDAVNNGLEDQGVHGTHRHDTQTTKQPG